MTQLIGINGFKRTGKGTVANMLTEAPDTGFVYQIGFADKLKRLAASTLGFGDLSPQDQIALMDTFKLEENGLYLEGDDPRMDDEYVTGRSFLQELGTRGRELFGPDFWINQVLPYPASDFIDNVEYEAEEPGRDLQVMYPEVDLVVITDLRFENEAQRIKDLGGTVWEIKRPNTSSDGHASEQALPRQLVDRTIFNEGTLDELRAKVEVAAQEDGLSQVSA